MGNVISKTEIQSFLDGCEWAEKNFTFGEEPKLSIYKDVDFFNKIKERSLAFKFGVIYEIINTFQKNSSIDVSLFEEFRTIIQTRYMTKRSLENKDFDWNSYFSEACQEIEIDDSGETFARTIAGLKKFLC